MYIIIILKNYLNVMQAQIINALHNYMTQQTHQTWEKWF